METPIYNPVTKVVKLIDPVDVPGYRMKMMYQQRNIEFIGLKPIVGPIEKLYANAKTN